MAKNIVILTGSGISAESGLKTFRDAGGLWEGYRVEEVATPEAYEANPALVQKFYNLRRQQLKETKPNAAHLALAELEKNWKGDFFLITQNVDDLHGRAGNKNLLHMHGELKKVRCGNTHKVFDFEDEITEETKCQCCSKTGALRPHIVWFGEMPLGMELIYKKLQAADIFVSIGTSGVVYPAAGFVQEVRHIGLAETVEINLEPSAGHSLFEKKIYGPASKTVPEFVKELLSS
jgi:NAD-dependent deacetylase